MLYNYILPSGEKNKMYFFNYKLEVSYIVLLKTFLNTNLNLPC